MFWLNWYLLPYCIPAFYLLSIQNCGSLTDYLDSLPWLPVWALKEAAHLKSFG